VTSTLQESLNDEEMPEQPVGRSSHQGDDSGSDSEAPAPKQRPASGKAQSKPAGKVVDLDEEDSESEDDLLPRKKATAGSTVIPLARGTRGFFTRDVPPASPMHHSRCQTWRWVLVLWLCYMLTPPPLLTLSKL